LLLDLDRAAHGIDHTGKFGQHAIAGCAHNAAAVLVDEGVYDLTAGSEGMERSLLIFVHEAAVALHIGAEDSGEFALDAVLLHGRPSL
jgi:hypothetical protein